MSLVCKFSISGPTIALLFSQMEKIRRIEASKKFYVSNNSYVHHLLIIIGMQSPANTGNEVQLTALQRHRSFTSLQCLDFLIDTEISNHLSRREHQRVGNRLALSISRNIYYFLFFDCLLNRSNLSEGYPNSNVCKVQYM